MRATWRPPPGLSSTRSRHPARARGDAGQADRPTAPIRGTAGPLPFPPPPLSFALVAGDTTSEAARRFAEAHRALLADPDVQFSMRPVAPPAKPPGWLVALGRFLNRVFAPIGRAIEWLFGLLPDVWWARAIFGGLLALLAAALVTLIALRLREGRWRLPRRRRAVTVAAEPDVPDWTPGAAPARALLAEADALAAAGRFAEAAHLLLRRSVEDIARRRPALVRPALTSRDLAAADVIPAAARGLFAGIAAAVERSLFGGRPLGEPDWLAARAAYADFALPRAWTAREAAA